MQVMWFVFNVLIMFKLCLKIKKVQLPYCKSGTAIYDRLSVMKECKTMVLSDIFIFFVRFICGFLIL